MRAVIYICIAYLISSNWSCSAVQLTQEQIQESVDQINSYAKSTDSLEKVTNKVLLDFEKASDKDSLKATIWDKKARELHYEFEAISAYLEDIQLLLIIKINGLENNDREAALERLENPNTIENKNEINTGNNVMIKDGMGISIKRELQALNGHTIILIKPKDEAVLIAISSILNTSDPIMDSYQTRWEHENFGNKPLIILIERLSYWRNQIRKVELIAIKYLEAEFL